MPKCRCLDCGTLTPSTRCPNCQRSRQRTRNRERPHYHGDYRTRRAAVLAEATHCWLCGQPLTSAPWPHPRSSTADHVTPGDSASELRAAHLGCNASRGAQPAD